MSNVKDKIIQVEISMRHTVKQYTNIIVYPGDAGYIQATNATIDVQPRVSR